jgi:hypothetical protein
MKKLLWFVTLLCGFFLAAPVFAVKVSSLYQAELPVASQSVGDRQQAEQEGLLQVLLKLSGDPQAANNALVKASVAKADYYVQEFSYVTLPNAAQHLIRINYSPEEIKKLMKQASISYWGERRPLILMWVAVTDPQSTEIIGDASGDTLTTIKYQGKKYGLPLIFPMMDMQDVNQVSTNDVIEMNLPVLKEAGVRYAADAMLIGSLQQHANTVQSQWQLILNDQKWNWTLSGNSIEEVVSAVMDQTNQTLAKHYVVKMVENTPQLWLTLEVSNITERNDLTQLMQYLKQLTPVQKVQLMQVSGDTVEVSVLVNGSLTMFQQNAEIGKRLVLQAADSTDNKLLYEWTH